MDCRRLKLQFIAATDRLVQQLVLQLRHDNQTHMSSLCGRYDEVMVRLLKEPNTSKEL